MLNLSRNPKIGYFDIAFAVKENIVEFYVAMGNVFGVNKVEAIDYLLENLLGKWFFETTTLANVIQKVTSCAKLHYNHNVLLGFNCFVYFDYMIMSELQQQIDFLH